jgi:hypothetical protein
MKIRRLVRTFAAMPLPAYSAGTVICRQLGYPVEMADRLRELVKWERYKMFVR